MTVLRKSLNFALPIAIILLAIVAAKLIGATKPAPKTREAAVSMPVVDATRLVATRYPVLIRSQGTVQATMANTLVPAVAGTVTEVNPSFVAGGMFEQGDVLLQIDPRDFEIALTQAQANLAQSDAQLQEQQALAEQARAEWRSIGRSGQPSSFTLRVPQLAAAAANRDAAEAQVQRAELDLERTRLIAPYNGTVVERQVDLGQFVARGAPVGSIHSMHAADIRLPLNNRQLTYLTLPESSLATDAPMVELTASIGATEHIWTGSLIRAEGIDAATQQLNVIARINDPYNQSSRPLRVGQFVQASIEGQVLDNVFVIPRSALREEREVLIVDENEAIQRRQVTVAWSDESFAAISEGLNEGELLVTTPLSTVSDGTPVRASIDGAAPAPLES